MAWAIRGRSIEHCNCNSICPCFTSGLARPADNDRCIGMLAFEIERGEAEGVDLSGRSAIMITDAPAMMAEGGWRAGLIIDDGANEAQAKHLEAIFLGTAGGPMANFAPLISDLIGVERAPIKFSHAGGVHTVSAGDMIDGEFKDEMHPGAEKPLQLLNATSMPFDEPITVSPPVKSIIKAFGISIDNSGKHGTTPAFNWSA